MIQLEHITAFHPDQKTPALRDVSLHVPVHQTLAIVGGSGAGKSSLLKAVLRLIPLQSGHILIDEEDTAGMDAILLRRKIGMVFQGASLFPHMNVAENIGLVLRLSGMPAKQRQSRIQELLELMELPADFARRFPSQLSGGQRQRVGVARALAPSPAYLLMDEPFGALDAITRRSMQDQIKALRQQLNVTILFVTHDIMEAVSLGDQIAVMDQGKILQVGPVGSLIDQPANEVVASLVGKPLSQLSTFMRDNIA